MVHVDHVGSVSCSHVERVAQRERASFAPFLSRMYFLKEAHAGTLVSTISPVSEEHFRGTEKKAAM